MLDKLYEFLTSSTGQGLSLRVKSFIALIVPLLSAFGVTIVSAEVDKFIDALFVVIFGVAQAYGWIRRNFMKKNQMGAYAPK